jgi:glutaminyl-tRNA synthetase
LLQLVQENIVNGYDPRMPTISGLRRRGYTQILFVSFESIGVAKRENIIDFLLLEFCLRDDLNKTAASNGSFRSCKVVITNYPVEKKSYLMLKIIKKMSLLV